MDPSREACSAPVQPQQTAETQTPSRFRLLMQKIWAVVKFIFKAMAIMLLYYVNPSLFFASFLISIVCAQQAKETVEKIEKVFKSKPWLIIPSFLSLPVALAAASIVVGAHLGSHAYLETTVNS